ncbi:unnamed protein product [Rotaria socialis]|uniref:UBC core domain-containing protein n=2 Tax=Rotaria socialis TaxID=392032 RepID=A0A818AKG9_9BILA|nr:unnamed protein product [Rotaria socialis]CAF3350586.1 unnamed protein product [Rotaria socialis]CAF3406866.1 unnamed protein product [Rotaria socialis]CAF4115554.1 unnamed protein product [Rotaria socialis]CAF4257587.1 unnamed protein product [Rotaria socialis]
MTDMLNYIYPITKPRPIDNEHGVTLNNDQSHGLAVYKLVVADSSDFDALPSICQVTYPDPNNLLRFILTIAPDDGYYRGGSFKFSFDIGQNYPYEPPKVKCTQKIYHPNIDLEGNVCLNILREDWTPVLNLTSIIFGIIFLFASPNPSDPLNKEAAKVLNSNAKTFTTNARQTMAGGTINGVQYDRVLI